MDDEEFILPSYVWEWNPGTDGTNGTISKYRSRRLSTNSPFRDWKIVCGFTDFTPNATTERDGYDVNGDLCQGSVPEDEYLTRNWLWGKYTYPDGTWVDRNPTLPNATEVNDLFKIPIFDRIDRNDLEKDEDGKPFMAFQSFNRYVRNSFRNSLEGFMASDSVTPGTHMHNLVHNWVGGPMQNVPIAANDPVFFLHHCNVDRIFETWLRKYGETADYRCTRFGVTDVRDQPAGCPIGHDFREFMAPFFPLKSPHKFFKMSTSLGYDYDELAKDTGADPLPLGAAANAMEIAGEGLTMIVIGALVLVVAAVLSTIAAYSLWKQKGKLHRDVETSPTSKILAYEN